MKNTLLAAILAAAPLVYADASTECSNKNPDMANAIGKFCQAFPLYVPTASTKEDRGIQSDHGNSAVCIQSTCSPRQYVSLSSCYSQFWDICATGNKKGHGSKQYGNKDPSGSVCQTWITGKAGDDCDQAVKSYKRDLSWESVDDAFDDDDGYDEESEDENTEAKARNAAPDADRLSRKSEGMHRDSLGKEHFEV
ncbi:hypothetical protein Tdes44962_MAKER07251 [Teratosphaeria destructans]|uniref:Secreted protein n=1 Tax=Teratosphaeria destructans TaxID=418781 RepID=A0A9W7SZN2_9PEZI|nr:hypothetical protein Tdes44962_MAKER07251 [Teratosphaeria destructans]